jgi:hypothetical protein
LPVLRGANLVQVVVPQKHALCERNYLMVAGRQMALGTQTAVLRLAAARQRKHLRAAVA